MNVLLFGATGMVGQGVLRECLLDSEVESVLAVGRAATGQKHDKLREIVHEDLFDLRSIDGELRGFDACFLCLGVSSAGMSEEDYRRVTKDLTLTIARTLAPKNPAMTFVYVSGAGTNAEGRSMWARVKGETENALLDLPFKAAFMFRPGGILPMHGVRSRTRLYRIVYAVMTPLYPLFKLLLPNAITTSERLGRAMLVVAKRGAPKAILETKDINELGGA